MNAEELPNYISQLIKQYYWVVFWALPDENSLTLNAIDQADLRVVLGAAFVQPAHRLAPNHLYADDDTSSIHKLARRLAQRQVGLALSGGNVRGMAHIGVHKALREENIPVDLIAGTSAGALFGRCTARGVPSKKWQSSRSACRSNTTFSPTFAIGTFSFPPRWGLIKGNKFLEHLRQLLPGYTFEEQKIPLAVVAADLVSGEEIVLERSPLAEALRASMSMGGLS